MIGSARLRNSNAISAGIRRRALGALAASSLPCEGADPPAQAEPPWLAPFMYVKTGIAGSIRATPPGTKKLLSAIPYRRWVS